MTIPITIGFPQVILFIVFVIGVGLLISSVMSLQKPKGRRYVEDEYGRRKYYRARRRFKWMHGIGGVVLLIVAVSLLWLTMLAQTFLGLQSDIPAARVTATTFGNVPHLMDVQVTLYDPNGHATTLRPQAVYGDRWMLDADVVEFYPWLNVLGIHSGYKLIRLEGFYDDSNLERTAQHTVIDLNGGDNGSFKAMQEQAWTSPFIKGGYGSSTFLYPDGRTYNVFMSQNGLKAEPAR
ncbi:MAG TPA: hypothetical protein VH593_30905 [Ktedonobacteraceae bacterium]|jgi:hypothetical protein